MNNSLHIKTVILNGAKNPIGNTKPESVVNILLDVRLASG
jgi:hypothetical protein